MTTLEAPPQNDIDPRIQAAMDNPSLTGIDKRELAIFTDKPSSNYMRRQMQLMIQKYLYQNPDANFDHKSTTAAAIAWTESGDSQKFAVLSKDPRFGGDVANIRLEDMLEN